MAIPPPHVPCTCLRAPAGVLQQGIQWHALHHPPSIQVDQGQCFGSHDGRTAPRCRGSANTRAHKATVHTAAGVICNDGLCGKTTVEREDMGAAGGVTDLHRIPSSGASRAVHKLSEQPLAQVHQRLRTLRTRIITCHCTVPVRAPHEHNRRLRSAKGRKRALLRMLKPGSH